MSEVTTIVGQPVAVQSLPLANSPAPDDYLVIDGVTEGTRRILAGALQARLDALEARIAAAEQAIRQMSGGAQ